MSKRCENVLRYGNARSVEIMMAAFNPGRGHATGFSDAELRRIRQWLEAY